MLLLKKKKKEGSRVLLTFLSDFLVFSPHMLSCCLSTCRHGRTFYCKLPSSQYKLRQGPEDVVWIQQCCEQWVLQECSLGNSQTQFCRIGGSAMKPLATSLISTEHEGLRMSFFQQITPYRESVKQQGRAYRLLSRDGLALQSQSWGAGNDLRTKHSSFLLQEMYFASKYTVTKAGQVVLLKSYFNSAGEK